MRSAVAVIAALVVAAGGALLFANRPAPPHYVIAARNGGSRYHRALLISYPNAADRARGATGGDIEIHGVPNSLGWIGSFAVARDWTAGCIAMRNSDIDELWRTVPAGTPIDIRP